MSLLNHAAIVAAQDLKTEDVDVPEWGGAVRLREMTAKERDAYETATFVMATEVVDGKPQTKVTPNTINLRARLVALCLVDEEGHRCFGDDETEALGAKSAAALARCFAVAQKLNGMGAAGVDEAEKNSTAAPSGEPS